MIKKSPNTIAISEFKATCLAVLEQVRRTGTPVVITRRGKPIAEVVPPSLASSGTGWLGTMRGSASIAEDLVAPAGEADDWEAFRA